MVKANRVVTNAGYIHTFNHTLESVFVFIKKKYRSIYITEQNIISLLLLLKRLKFLTSDISVLNMSDVILRDLDVTLYIILHRDITKVEVFPMNDDLFSC